MSRPGSRLGLGGKHRRSSSGSVGKMDLTESPKEKAKYKIKTKADPTKAINEAQPAMQELTDNTLENIRSIEHRDAEGNVITDPDQSNPTRPRLERPLDTIRSFEAAIDGSYNRRQSYRAESTTPFSPQNRRSSGFFNGNGHQSQQRNYQDHAGGGGGGYYGNRNSMNYGRPDSYVDGYGGSSGQHHGERRRFGPRNYSDPTLYGRHGEQGMYQSHNHQQSYDTVGTTSNGSHFTDQGGNSTDPSSENSSIDKFQAPPPAPPKQDLGDAYGFNGFGGAPQFQGPILEEYSHGSPAYGEPGYGQSNGYGQQNGYGQSNGHGQSNSAHVDSYPGQTSRAVPPSVPPHRAPMPPPKQTAPRVPPKTGQGPAVLRRQPTNDGGEKRKSWLKRRFSRS